MIPVRYCGLCGCSSNDTAIFSSSYAKGDLNICLECLADGISEISKAVKREVKEPINSELPSFNISIPQEVYGFTCQGCGNVLFANAFPVGCTCGYINTEDALQVSHKKGK